MMSQLIDVQAFLGVIQLLIYLAGVSLGLLLVALVIFRLRRWTAPERTMRRRVLSILGYVFLLPGCLIPLAVLVFWLVVILWPEPQIALSWDLTHETTMQQFDPARCTRTNFFQYCTYQGDITLFIGLPAGRTMTEKAKLVRVRGADNKLTAIEIYSRRYDVAQVFTKLEAYIADWRLNRQPFEEWKMAIQQGETRPLYYWWDDASSTTPRLWIMAKLLEEAHEHPWFLELALRWE
jgi:hypothetical protein